MATAQPGPGMRRRDRKDWAPAWIAAAAAVAAAVFTGVTSAQVSSAERDAQLAQVVHSQRVEAYAALLSAGRQLVTVANACPAVPGEPEMPSLSREFLTASAAVSLVGPVDVTDVLPELDDAASEIADLYDRPTGPATPAPDCDEYQTAVDDRLGSFESVLVGFGMSAHSDLEDVLGVPHP